MSKFQPIVVALATAALATGCVIEEDRGNTVAVGWNIEAGDPTNQNTWVDPTLRTILTCPVGFSTARFIAQEVDGLGNAIASPIFDLFDCDDNFGITAPYPPGLYQMWVEITNDAETQIYAQSASAYLDLAAGSQTFDANIVHNGGYFTIGWSLSGDGLPATCAQVAEQRGVSVLATVTGGSDAFEDLFDCEQGMGITADLPHGSYTVASSLLNAEGLSIGDAPVLSQRIIDQPNEFVDLGTVVISLQ